MNPELRRQLWLELSAQRLLVTPIIVALLLLTACLIDDGKYFSDAALWAAGAFGIVYGPRLASQALLDEIGARTWDAQRASALTAWQLTIGKLAGGTAFAWFGVACIFAGWLAGCFYMPREFSSAALTSWSRILLVSILAQAISLWFALLLAQDTRKLSRSFLCHAIGVAAGAIALWLTSLTNGPNMSFLNGISFEGTWWGLPWSQLLAQLCLAVFAAWSIAGAWRLMSNILQTHRGNWVWPAFLIWLVAWAMGFGTQDSWPWMLGYAVIFPVSYITALVEPKSEVSLRRWLAALRTRHWETVVEDIPAWLIVTLFLAALSLLFASQDYTTWLGTPAWRIMLLSAFLLFLRDLALLHLIGFNGAIGRGFAAALIYLAVLHGLLPALLNLAEMKAVTVMLTPLPPAGISPWLGPLCFAIEFLVIAYLAARRMRLKLSAPIR